MSKTKTLAFSSVIIQDPFSEIVQENLKTLLDGFKKIEKKEDIEATEAMYIDLGSDYNTPEQWELIKEACSSSKRLVVVQVNPVSVFLTLVDVEAFLEVVTVAIRSDGTITDTSFNQEGGCRKDMTPEAVNEKIKGLE